MTDSIVAWHWAADSPSGSFRLVGIVPGRPRAALGFACRIVVNDQLNYVVRSQPYFTVTPANVIGSRICESLRKFDRRGMAARACESGVQGQQGRAQRLGQGNIDAIVGCQV
jgi:hypothetical protein